MSNVLITGTWSGCLIIKLLVYNLPHVQTLMSVSKFLKE